MLTGGTVSLPAAADRRRLRDGIVETGSVVSSRTWPWPRGASRTGFCVLGLGLGLG